METMECRCARCGHDTVDDDAHIVDVCGRTEIWCDDCIERYATTCERCGARVAYSTTIHVTPYGTEEWCDDCVDEYAVECADCGERFANGMLDEYETYDGDVILLCEDCRYDNWYECEECGRIVSESDVEFIDDCAYCPDCADNRHSDSLESYGHTRGMSFWTDACTCIAARDMNDDDLSRLYMGLELETDYNDSACALADDIVAAYDGRYVSCKEDGSLHDNGVEIVSQPMTARAHLSNGMWHDIINIVRGHGGTSHDAGTCGLHIHLSRNYFASHDAVYRMDRLFHRFKNQMIRFSRRTELGMRWCGIGDDDIANIANVDDRKLAWANNKRYAGRYEVVNDTNLATVEIRLWRGTLNETTLRATIEFTAGLAVVCNTISDEFADRLTWKEFKSLVRYALVCEQLPYSEIDEYLSLRNL